MPCLLAVLAGGCAPNVDLATAPVVRSTEWRQPPSATPEGAVPLAASWSAFGSAELERLIARARAANPDLAVAAARITQARGQLGVARAVGRPTVAAFGGAETTRVEERGRSSFQSDSANLGLQASWEVDLFGAARAGTRTARARLAAAGYDSDALRLLIESEVARALVAHATLQDRLELLDRSLENARELERIILVRVREGAATRVDSGLQTIEVRQIEAERSRLIEAQARTRSALAGTGRL